MSVTCVTWPSMIVARTLPFSCNCADIPEDPTSNFVVTYRLLPPILTVSIVERPWSFGISDWFALRLLASMLIAMGDGRVPMNGETIAVDSARRSA